MKAGRRLALVLGLVLAAGRALGPAARLVVLGHLHAEARSVEQLAGQLQPGVDVELDPPGPDGAVADVLVLVIGLP